MRLTLLLASAAVIGSAVPAMAQDVVVTQILQRLCVPVVTARSWEASTWTAAESNARALNLTLARHSDDEDWTSWTYSLRQSSGVYQVEITRSLGGVSCSIDPPDTISRNQLEQAASSATSSGWEVSFNNRGPSWSRRIAGSGGFVGKTLTVNIADSSGGTLSVEVSEQRDSVF